MLTIRKVILEILRARDVTSRQLAEQLGIKEREVLEHLPHVQRSLGKKCSLIVDPARCLHCDYVFKKRERLNRPGRCPVCRSENVVPPILGIRENDRPADTAFEAYDDSED